MRKLFLILFLFVFGNAVGQKLISEGKVVFEITYPDMELDNQMSAMLPTESTVYFKGGMSRTEIPIGMGMSSSTIVNSKSGVITQLMDMMGTKSAVVIKESDGKSKDYKFSYPPGTKQIAGYTCKRAIITSKDSMSFEIYYTDQIVAMSATSKEWKELKGFPMEYVLNSGGFNMKMTAKTVSSEKVSDELFKVPPDYKIMTEEEFKKMMGGE